MMSDISGFGISPETAIYAAFARLNYAPWYALAEFVDNALQSYLANRSTLQAIHGPSFRLHIEIGISNDFIEVQDNAAGIAGADLLRAVRGEIPPPDASGLSEFGTGMKAAAYWFSRRWTISTSALGEPFESIIVFDISKITSLYAERLPVGQSPCQSSSHYTRLTLGSLNVCLKDSTISKIKRHLSSIYRRFLRDGSLELSVQGERLVYEPPELLISPRFDRPSGTAIEWRKEFSLTIDVNRRIWGWAGILKRGSLSDAGFALFRRGRVIEGSHGDAYRPELLFGRPNSYTYQRLVGELDTDGFMVSYTKDRLLWNDSEDEIIGRLYEALDAETLPLLRQAQNYRARPVWLREVLGASEPRVVEGQEATVGTDEKFVIDNESRELILVGKVFSIVAKAGQIYRGYTNSDHGIDGEIEFKDDQGHASGRRLYMQLKSGDSYLQKRLEDGAEVFQIQNPRWARYWQEQAYPVMLVFRASSGEIRWMNVTEYLKGKGQGGAAVRQIVFTGERFDVRSVRQWRNRVLSGGAN